MGEEEDFLYSTLLMNKKKEIEMKIWEYNIQF